MEQLKQTELLEVHESEAPTAASCIEAIKVVLALPGQDELKLRLIHFILQRWLEQP